MQLQLCSVVCVCVCVQEGTCQNEFVVIIKEMSFGINK